MEKFVLIESSTIHLPIHQLPIIEEEQISRTRSVGTSYPHRQAGSQPLALPFDWLSTTLEVWRPRSIILYDYGLPMH